HHQCLGIVGMGRIGQAIARRAALGFGMNILYYNRSRKPDIEAETGARQTELAQLLASADFICAVLPATPETRHLFDADTFRQMQSHAIFINIARGAIMDEAAL